MCASEIQPTQRRERKNEINKFRRKQTKLSGQIHFYFILFYFFVGAFLSFFFCIRFYLFLVVGSFLNFFPFVWFQHEWMWRWCAVCYAVCVTVWFDGINVERTSKPIFSSEKEMRSKKQNSRAKAKKNVCEEWRNVERTNDEELTI